MNYQKLAKTLLRVMAVWLIVQGIQDLVAAFRTISEYSSHASNVNEFIFTETLPGITLLVMVLILLFASDRISKFIADPS